MLTHGLFYLTTSPNAVLKPKYRLYAGEISEILLLFLRSVCDLLISKVQNVLLVGFHTLVVLF